MSQGNRAHGQERMRRAGDARTAVAALAVAAVLAAAPGCGSHEPPRAELEQADLAVRRAADSQATRYAPTEMRQARAKLERARKAFADEEYERAEFLAEQAAVDADLAQARAEARAAEQVADDARRRIEALRRGTPRAETLERRAQ
jgi:hypothetical protein